MNLSNKQIEELRDEWRVLQRTIYGPSDKTRTEFVEKLLTMLTDKTAPQEDSPEPREWPEGAMLEAAWGLIANANEGDWEKAHPDWYAAAVRWRDAYHRLLDGVRVPAPQGDAAPPGPWKVKQNRESTYYHVVNAVLARTGTSAFASYNETEALAVRDVLNHVARGGASSPGSALSVQDIKELNQEALDLAEKEYWRDNGDARHNLAVAILTYLNAS